MSLDRFCRRPVVTAEPDAPIAEVAGLMRDLHVGCVVIAEEGVPVGVVTDRDLVIRVLAEARAGDRPIGEVMTTSLETVRVEDQLDDVVARMRHAGVRRLPIVDTDGVLRGLVSLDDVAVLLAGELGASVEAIRSDRGP